MKVGLLSKDEIQPIIELKLRSGWCIIQGDSKTISEIEDSIYTPGTDRNKDFEIIGLCPSLCFGRKTRELRKLLGNPADYNEILLITVERINDHQMKTELTGANTPEAVVMLAEEATRQITQRRR